MFLRFASLLLALLLPAAAAEAVVAGDLRVSLVTFAPGEAVYERFGHNALLFLDTTTGQSVAYDWGRFDFEQPGFLARFIRGDMLYSTGEADGEALLDYYLRQGRGVSVQVLNLSPQQAESLLAACETAYRPENRDYRYDYFTENCSTKLRDALDSALEGQLKDALASMPAETTYRRESERYMAPDPLFWFGIHAGFGPYAEQSLDAWQQSFLPNELRRWLRDIEVTSADGRRVPLVAREVVLQENPLAPVAAVPPRRWLTTGLIGVVAAGVMLLMSTVKRPILARLAASMWFLLAGLAGTFGVAIWLFTSHVAGHANQTILLLSPLGVPLAIMALVGRVGGVGWWRRATGILALIHLALCVIGTILHLVPGVGQANAAVVTLALPLNAAAAWVVGARWPSLPRAAGREEDSPSLTGTRAAGLG